MHRVLEPRFVPNPVAELAIAEAGAVRSLGDVSELHDAVTWSPDGRFLAAVVSARSSEVAVIPVDGSARVVIGRGSHPTWSPNSARVAVVPPFTPGQLDVVRLLPLSGGVASDVALPAATGQIEALAWSPDGARILVSDRRGRIVTLGIGSTASTTVTTRGRDARWLPDGRILFRERDGRHVVVSDVRGGGRRPVLFRWETRVRQFGSAPDVPAFSPS